MSQTQSFLHVDRLADVPESRPTYLAIGSFDGVHRGHQAIIKNMVAAAREANVRSAVLTFFPHPKRVILGLTDRYYITTLADRVSLLADLGVDLVITHPFDEEVRQIRAADFVEELCGKVGMVQLWGGNFALGYNREGDVAFLRALGLERGFSVESTETLVSWNGQPVSSSRIREALNRGDVAEVAGCLARPYAIGGTVMMGDQRGRTIGFPTANVGTWEELILPANGVYATRATVAGQTYSAATNVGVRPTVSGQTRTVEAHLLDFSGDLYGQAMTLTFHHRIRPERRFDGLDSLKQQIQTDVGLVRELLDSEALD